MEPPLNVFTISPQYGQVECAQSRHSKHYPHFMFMQAISIEYWPNSDRADEEHSVVQIPVEIQDLFVFKNTVQKYAPHVATKSVVRCIWFHRVS